MQSKGPEARVVVRVVAMGNGDDEGNCNGGGGGGGGGGVRVCARDAGHVLAVIALTAAP